MKKNPLLQLTSLGQSVWLDFIQRGMFASDELQRLIEEDGISGVTSNPAIFQKAIAGSRDYEDDIRRLARQGKNAEEIYWTLAIADIQQAADLFRPTYDRTAGRDGFVSLEVSPHLAHDTDGTVAEARKLWTAVDRPNILIKVPGTAEGLPSIERLLTDGINVNITLLFGLPRYRQVAEIYCAALEARASRGQPLNHVASVASFFLSRFDVLLDPLLEKIVQEGGPKAETARSLKGKVALAQAKTAHPIYQDIFGGTSFRKLASQGAFTQRLLWASTSTKNPEYNDVMYVEPLIGPDTINTLPLETVTAYRDHGNPAPRLEEGLEAAREQLARLAELGISMDQVTEQLEAEGVQKFIKPFDALLGTLEAARTAAGG
ncbi:MAG: transaldolase [Pirellulales bacterium]|nr:transaldolase [Pirellulales bacterium]